MAMIPCKECGKEVSSEAFKCPNCGARLRKAKRGFFGKIFKWSFVLFNLLMFLWIIFVIFVYGDSATSTNDGIEQAANVVAGSMWIGASVTVWVIVDIILGIFVLLTRPKE